MARNQRAAALKAWITRRAGGLAKPKTGGHASGMGPVAVGSAELRRARVGSRVGSGGHASGMGPVTLSPTRVARALATAHVGPRKAWATRRARGGGGILSSGQRAMATNLGGPAKSGPPPTRTSQLTAALKASVVGSSARLGLPAWKDRPVRPAGVREASGYDPDARARLKSLKAALTKGQRAYANRKAREQVMRDAGLVKVRGARGGIYWE